MKIAIIGTGISGLTAAHYLRHQHQITLYESDSHTGGHTHTLDVDYEGEQHRIDAGFIVFNDWTYPNFIKLLHELGVASQPTTMSFSVRCEQTELEYSGNNLNTLFAQRSNLWRPSFYRMLRDILRFNKESPAVLADLTERTTVGEYCRQHRYSTQFVEQYLFPMGSAIWSCPPAKFADFPLRFLIEFYQNHGLLSVINRPTWRVIRNGSRSYVDALTAPFLSQIHHDCPVQSVRRLPDWVEVSTAQRGQERYDHVIMACHSDQALRLLADPAPVESELLSEFPYQPNVAVLHTDTTILPRRKRAWAAWNYHIPKTPTECATVTYNMNLLQNLKSKHVFCVTLNAEAQIDPTKVIRRIHFQHPVYTIRRAAAQQRHYELIGQNRTSYCGAYWGNGFHEDGVNSALKVCRVLSH